MWFKTFFSTLILLMTWSCRTTNIGSRGAETPASLSAETTIDPAAKCDQHGGESIDGRCVCSDGTDTTQFGNRAKTCTQWIKLSDLRWCFDKGGTIKKGEKKTQCFCSHGETIKQTEAGTCYKKFATANPTCANMRGIIKPQERVCTCAHGPTVRSLKGLKCNTHHAKQSPDCHANDGLAVNNGLCRCRDGSTVIGRQKCPEDEKWFFADGSSVGVNGSGKSNPKTGKKAAPPDSNIDSPCVCTWYNNNLVLYKPNPERAAIAKISWPAIRKGEITQYTCYANFREIIDLPIQPESTEGGCGGVFNYKQAPGAGSGERSDFNSERDPNSMCVCKPYRKFYSQYSYQDRCGMAKPGGTYFFISWESRFGCTQDDCLSLAAGSDLLYSYCPEQNGQPLWRYQPTPN